jgi:PiT family inorganic phosphate transporter
MELSLLVVTVAVALVFDFTNGFHDAANAIATSVSTRALSPLRAVLMAGSLNFAGAFLISKVAATVASGIVNTSAVSFSPIIILATVTGAITWNLVTWYWGIPNSSSHALIGSLVGAAVAAGGLSSVSWGTGVVNKFLIPTTISPFVGFGIGFGLMVTLLWVFRHAMPARINRYFLRLQILSAGAQAFSHGTNDAQKTMGVIVLALYIQGVDPTKTLPLWVIVASASAMGLGTGFGGWRIVRTMGMRMTKLLPINGFAAETSAATVLLAVANLGFPVSTTHVISSSIMGVGATKRLSAVRWGVARKIIFTWLITLPAAALVAAGFYYLLSAFL